VSGPLGDPVDAPWRLVRGTAVIEMALAAGLALVGGPEGNDAGAASTAGVGELIAAAVEAGARRVLVGMGGSATTDGGLGALRALYPLPRLRGIELVVGCDVTCGFVDAAEVFAPQKGASPAEVELLRRRLERLAQVYLADHGVDVITLEGAGAAGGLAGGLAVAGGELVSGFQLVADELDLWEHLEDADLVVTGEGFCDEQSFEGKVVGGVVEAAADAGVPVLVVAGQLLDGVERRAGAGVTFVSLSERFGEERSCSDTAALVAEVVRGHVSALG
jgi:glycerate kinase